MVLTTLPALPASRLSDLCNKSIPALTQQNQGLSTLVLFVAESHGCFFLLMK